MEKRSSIRTWWVNSFPHRLSIRRAVPKFLRQCPDPFRGEVLEVGAGQGWTSQEILETFPQVELTATDITPSSEDLFDELRREYGRRLRVREANVIKLPFDRDAFDVVIAINTISMLPPYALKKAVQEMLRVTRPGGLIGISETIRFIRSGASRSRVLLEQILQDEQCEIVSIKGSRRYNMWVRKRYPIEPGA
jgi:SAM-dependent methyltransferase